MIGSIISMIAFPIFVLIIAAFIFPGYTDHFLDHIAGYDK